MAQREFALNRKQICLLITLSLLTGCSADGVSQKEMEDLVSQARVDAAAKQYADAEKKLLKCLEYANKDTQLSIRLKVLNQLADLESEQHNSTKAKEYMQTAGNLADEYSRSDPSAFTSAEPRLLKEAIKAMIRRADDFAEFGRYDAARSFYLGAREMHRADLDLPPEDSPEIRLQKLQDRVRSEKHAIEQEDGLNDSKDPKFAARVGRTAARRALMDQMKVLTLVMMKNPNTETLDRMFPIVEKIRTAYGDRESEYRAALENTVNFGALHGHREKALALLKSDMALYENIDVNRALAADTQSLEDSTFLISDLASYTKLMMHEDNYIETRNAALRGIKLAEDVRHVDSESYANLLKAAAWEREQRTRYEEAISFRQRQIAMLKNLKLTDDYPFYYEGRLELGHDLLMVGRAKDGLPEIEYAISRLKVKQPKDEILAYAYTAKAECLRSLGELQNARQCMIDAQKLWELRGGVEQKFGCYRILSKVSRGLKRFDEAHQAGLKALQNCQKLPTAQRLSALPDAYQELAQIEMERKRYKEAEAYERKALEAQLKVQPEPSFAAAGMLNLIALAATNQGKLAEAEALRLRAVKMCRDSKETPRTPELSTQLQLANFYETTKQSDKAEKSYREFISATEKLKKRGGEEMKDQYAIQYLRAARLELAQLLRDKKPLDSKKLKDESLQQAPSLMTADPVQDCNYYLKLGDLCMNLSDFENAEKVLQEAEKLAGSTKPPLTDWQIQVLSRKRELYKATKREKLAQGAASELERLKNPPGGQ